MNRAMCRIAGAASGVSRGSAWKTCTWSGQTCSSHSPPAALMSAANRRASATSISAPPAWMSVGGIGRPPATSSVKPRMGEIGFRAVQPDEPLGVADTDRRVAPQCFPGARQLEGEVDQRRHQHHRGRMVDVGLQQQVDGEMAARRVTCDDHPLRGQAVLVLSASPIRPAHPLRRVGNR